MRITCLTQGNNILMLEFEPLTSVSIDRHSNHTTKILCNIHCTVSSANRSLCFINRNLYSCQEPIKTYTYSIFARPLFEYSSVREEHPEDHIGKIGQVQRRTASFVAVECSIEDSSGILAEWIRRRFLDTESQWFKSSAASVCCVLEHDTLSALLQSTHLTNEYQTETYS